ncbi:MAG: hypothetical protein AAF558_00180 [Verrucomicrobiota bacterium]
MGKNPQIDKVATNLAILKFGLPASVQVSIAAREESDISKYIGRIKRVLAAGTPNNALFVEPYSRSEQDDPPICQLEESKILHHPKQVWVHVNYTRYRSVFLKAFEKFADRKFVFDHVMNRRVARLKGFSYLRIVPISRGANSSSGGLSEKWSVKYHSSSQMIAVNSKSPARIQYADLPDLVKMLNMRTGGKPHVPINDAQALVTPPC